MLRTLDVFSSRSMPDSLRELDVLDRLDDSGELFVAMPLAVN